MAVYLSQSKYAELCGITRQAVSLAVKEGRVCLAKNQKVDPDHPTNRYFRHAARNRLEREPAPVPAELPPAGPKGKQRKRNGKKNQNGLTKSVLKQLDLPETGAGMFKNQVDVAKGVEQTRALQIKNEEMRNKLISRDLVKRYFSELYTIETTELLNLGERLSPELASIFGVDEPAIILDASKYIQRELSKTLEHIEITINKFLKMFPMEEN